jgi:putative tricarboxylic transport membrane protein
MGLFGVAEVLSGLETMITRSILQEKIKNLFPNKEDWKRSTLPIVRGSFIGFIAGIIPGAGPVCLHLYRMPLRRSSRNILKSLGRGAIEGIAGPETANNAATGGLLFPC